MPRERSIDKTMAPPSQSQSDSVFKIPPYHFIHVLDLSTNVTRLEVGPATFVRKDNEMVVSGPQKMVTVPPRHYCVVLNPVVRDKENKIELDSLGQVKLQHAEEEIRLAQDPFPLYPGEELKLQVTLLTVVPALGAIKLKVTRDFKDESGVERKAGDEILFEGPGTYIPRKELDVQSKHQAIIIKPNTAVKLRATRETVDRNGKQRVAGEEWMLKKNGAYLPGVYEEVVESIKATYLTDKLAVHVIATQSFKDENLNKTRKSGEEYLVTIDETETFIPDVYEQVVGTVDITTLNNRQYCVINNPIGENGKPQLGAKKLVKGEKSFFLQPGETLEDGIQEIFILGENEGVVLRANEAFSDEFVNPSVERQPGDRWMLKGPTEYIPPVEVEVVTRRRAIPLHENEGIYVRNTNNGQVRAVIGSSYMLGEDEELWEKNIPDIVRTLISTERDTAADRGDYVNPNKEKRRKRDLEEEAVFDSSKVVSFQVPHNAAVQIYDFKSKKSRVQFGPDLVMLGPDEQFTQLSLSGGKPKKGNMIRAIALLLGPDFASDIIVVETADHARLQLDLSYNWHFVIKDKNNLEEASKIFCVADFTGDLCKAMASKIRGAVSAVTFDDFHKNSAKIIQVAVFGTDPETRQVRETINFSANNLVVTSVDIKSVEPVDQRTRDSLQKSVTLAIEITTQSQEAAARREAERIEQEAKGKLERQKILDESEAEKARRELLSLQAESSAVESTGQAKAEAISRAEAAKIEAEAAVQAAKLKAEALKIETESELERLKAAREADVKFALEQNQLEIEKAEKMAKIETGKFEQMVSAIGKDTMLAMASGPQDHQVKMLQSLGLSSTLITDGRTPINLLSTASGLLGSTMVSSEKE